MVRVLKFGHTPKVINIGPTAQTEKSLTNRNNNIGLHIIIMMMMMMMMMMMIITTTIMMITTTYIHTHLQTYQYKTFSLF